MISTTTPQVPDFLKDLVPQIIKAFGDGLVRAYRIIWDAFIPILKDHWISILVFLVFLLFVSFVGAITTGRWAMFGSVLYNYLYFGTLFFVGLIFGPELFANDYFQVFLVILYVVCFLLVGKVLHKIGLRRY